VIPYVLQTGPTISVSSISTLLVQSPPEEKNWVGKKDYISMKVTSIEI
jgi:hypothetical protein